MAIPINHILAHFGHAFPFLTLSAKQFYTDLEEVIKQHEFPDLKIERTLNKEGGAFSANREYLRIRFHDLVFEICGMQFGKDFCITSWLYETEGTLRQLLKFTKAGDYLTERAKKKTFYEADQEAMFKYCIHNSLLEVIDNLTKANGLRTLSDFERQFSR